METLKEKLAKHWAVYKKTVASEKAMNTIVRRILKHIPSDTRITTYPNNQFISVSAGLLDIFEDVYMLPLTLEFKIKWERIVDAWTVLYKTEVTHRDQIIRIYFNTKVDS